MVAGEFMGLLENTAIYNIGKFAFFWSPPSCRSKNGIEY